MKLPQELAQDSAEKFLETFKNLYEHSPWFVEQSLESVLANEKYNSLKAFHQLLCEIMLSSNHDLQDNLIIAHPLLAGKSLLVGAPKLEKKQLIRKPREPPLVAPDFIAFLSTTSLTKSIKHLKNIHIL